MCKPLSAEAYFGIAEEFIEEGKKRLEPDMLEVIDRFFIKKLQSNTSEVKLNIKVMEV